MKRIEDDAYQLLLLKADHLTRWHEFRTLQSTREAVASLENAASFHRPSRGYYWLMANCLFFLDDRKHVELRRTALETPADDAAELFYIIRDRRWGTFSDNLGSVEYSFEEQHRDLLEVLRVDPHYHNGLFFLAYWLSNANRKAEALAAWYGYIALEPDDEWAISNRGGVHLSLNNYEEAIADFRQAIHLAPSYAAFHYNLGTVLRIVGRNDEALAALREAMRLDPELGEAYTNLGAVLHDMGKHEEAIAACLQAVNLRPNDAVALSTYAVTLRAVGRVDEAITALRKAIRLDPLYVDAYNNLSNVYIDAGNFDDVITISQQAIDRIPTAGGPHLNLGVAFHNLERLDQALAEYRTALTLLPPGVDKAACHYNLAHALSSLGEHDQAISELTEALAMAPDDADTLNSLAWLLATCPNAGLRDSRRAVELATRASHLSPQDLGILNTLGVAQYRAAQYAEAKASLMKSLSGRGDDLGDLFFLAMSEWRLGNQRAARMWYAKAVELLEKAPSTADDSPELIDFRDEAHALLFDAEAPAGEPRNSDAQATDVDS